jgi:hypothetical protein
VLRNRRQHYLSTQDAIRDVQIPIADRDPTFNAAAAENPHQMVRKNIYKQDTAPPSTANGRGDESGRLHPGGPGSIPRKFIFFSNQHQVTFPYVTPPGSEDVKRSDPTDVDGCHALARDGSVHLSSTNPASCQVPAWPDVCCCTASHSDVAEGSTYDDEDFLSLPQSHLATGQPAPRNESTSRSDIFPQARHATQDAIREGHIPIADRDPTSSTAVSWNAHQMAQNNMYI